MCQTEIKWVVFIFISIHQSGSKLKKLVAGPP